MSNSDRINTRKLILNKFKGEANNQIVWQPRIYYWYYGNGLMNKTPKGYKDESFLQSMREDTDSVKNPDVPERYKKKTMLEIYDNLGASPRYPQEVLGVQLFKGLRLPDPSACDQLKTEVELDSKNGQRKITYKTPAGNLTKVESGYIKEYPVKNIEDIEIMEYIIQHTEVEFDQKAFELADEVFGRKGPIQTFFIRSPYQSLITEYMGFKKTILMLNKHKDRIQSFMNTIDNWHDDVFDLILDSQIEILNFGENIDQHYNPPPIFEKYLLPYYERRIKEIHNHDKYCHIHVDGSFKQLIPLLKETSFDGLEALTPQPQGDVTLEELQEALGDKILLDGIPATFFTKSYSYQKLESFTKRLIDYFAPRLIIGVSDEVPPNANIEKVRYISKILEDYP